MVCNCVSISANSTSGGGETYGSGGGIVEMILGLIEISSVSDSPSKNPLLLEDSPVLVLRCHGSPVLHHPLPRC